MTMHANLTKTRARQSSLLQRLLCADPHVLGEDPARSSRKMGTQRLMEKEERGEGAVYYREKERGDMFRKEMRR